MATASVLMEVVRARGSQPLLFMQSPATGYENPGRQVQGGRHIFLPSMGNTVSFPPPSHRARNTSPSSR